MMSRQQALSAIAVGDLIYGIREDGRPDLLLVYSADITGFLARNVPNQTTFRFGRDGEGRRIEDGRGCTIVSTAKLPPDLREVAIGLDRRMGSKPEYPDSRVTEDEIRLVLTHDEFFEARLLPGMEGLVRRAQKLRGVEKILMVDWDPAHARDNPPFPNQYHDSIPALVDLLGRAPSQNDVARFLTDLASQHLRSANVIERTDAAVASLLRLRETWT